MSWVPQLTTKDDYKVIQQIQYAHSPDAKIDVDLKSVLKMISQGMLPLLDSKTDHADPDVETSQISPTIAPTIHTIGCELSCNCTGEGSLKDTTLSVFNTLKKYEWDAKVVLALAAFTASYGEFLVLSQPNASNKLVKYAQCLKPLPDISERESLITELLKVVVKVADCIIELIDLLTQCTSRHIACPSSASSFVAISVYWAIKGIVACSFQSIGLINVGHDQYTVSNTAARKQLTEPTQALKSCYEELRSQLDRCISYILEATENEDYNRLVHIVDTVHTDSMKFFTEFFHTKEGLPLFNGADKKRVSLDVLKGKAVILFFSNLDISDEEIQEIKQQVGEQEGRPYEILWIPIDGSVNPKEFERKAISMPCYSFLVVQPGAIKFIKEKWHFENKPLIVVFLAQGRIIWENAYHNMMIWGSKAWPFDKDTVRSLWEQTPWSLELLLHERDKAQLVKDRKIVCFYGGGDKDWIMDFTSKIKQLENVEGEILELIYVGKKHTEAITTKKLSNIKKFRARLESIMCSKLELGKTILKDTVLKDVMMMLADERGGNGWTLLAHGSKDLDTMNAVLAMKWLEHFKNVNETITFENFFSKVHEALKEIKPDDYPHPDKHCNHIPISSTYGINQESMLCLYCERPMKKVIVFECCDEE